jgi:hypothetical protein
MNTAPSKHVRQLVLLLALCAGCAARPVAPGEVGGASHDASERNACDRVAEALREGRPLLGIEPEVREWLVQHGGWDQRDLEDLDEILNQSRTGRAGSSLTGVGGVQALYEPEDELSLRARIARERNGLLADMIEQGRLAAARDFLLRRRAGEWHQWHGLEDDAPPTRAKPRRR